jgi:hypothetical protein
MNHVLGLCFEYHRYHRDAVVRVYADDRLVDESLLTDDIKLKTADLSEMPSYSARYGPYNWTRVEILPEKLFLYEIDGRHLGQRIRIEVVNDQNNHTNGFMTDFAYIKFYRIFLMPSCFLQYDSWERLDDFCPKNDDNRFPHLPRLDDIEVISSSSAWSTDFIGCIKGGSFTIDIPLYKKHKISHLGKVSPGKLAVDWSTLRMLWRFNSLNTTT